YTVTYKNNVNIGTASVVVTGKGNYTGSMTTKFKIIPAKVSGLKQTKCTTNSISLKWNKVAGATGYTVYIENATTGELKAIGNATKTSGKIKNLKAGTKYRVVVKAYATVNGKKVYGNASATKTMITKTTTTKVTVTSKTKKKALVAWEKVTGADGYEVYISIRRASGFNRVAIKTKNITRYTKNNLTSGKTYYFKVRSFKYNGSGIKVYSAYSNVKSVKIK
ncbi:MAG: fibronectin type III domain-containing protein, partial [Lachnospiraceae bacterium]|nr:fibronectin type III domain-containing protein [Lachnospiraceae bacterium]